MVGSRHYFDRRFPFGFQRLFHLATFSLFHLFFDVPPHVRPRVPRFNGPERLFNASVPTHWCIMEFLQNLPCVLILLSIALSFGGNAVCSTKGIDVLVLGSLFIGYLVIGLL